MDTDTDADADANGNAEEVDWETAPNSGAGFPADPKCVAFLRETADGIYGKSFESRQVSAILYRVNDLYDPDSDTSLKKTYLNVRHITGTKAQGGIDR